MATLSPVIVPAKALKGGRHKIRVSLSHNGETRYLLTDIVIDSEKEFKNGQIVKRPDAAFLNTKLRGILQRYQQAMDDVPYSGGMTCPELVHAIKHGNRRTHRTLTSIYEEMSKYSDITQSSKKLYDCQMQSIVGCLGDILVEHVTHSSVLAYERHMRDRGLRPSTIRNRMRLLSSLLRYAERCGYDCPRTSPFAGYQFPISDPRDSWLTVEQIKKIRDYTTKSKAQSRMRDFFMLSYYLGGINLADLVNLNLRVDVLKYERKKTVRRHKANKYVEFTVPEEAKEIILRRTGEDGRLKLTKFEREKACNSTCRHNLRRISENLGIPNLVYYSARKSFSQHAFLLGVPTPVIDYLLGHRVDKGGTSLYSYISVTPEMATKALRKVLDNLK